ncbi:MAG: YraN family protein [Candidatus Limnocylindria bacterium]
MGIAKIRGKCGEALAAAYLELVGFELLGRNVKLAGVEVDLIARDRSTQVLVEVKMRGRTDYGGAALAVDHRQRERLRRAAHALLVAHPGAVRIDLIAIELAQDGAAVRHYRNAITE